MRHLSIDIETYSSINLKKSGLYKYAEAPDFQVLLFAYSLDGAPVDVVDFSRGEELPWDIAGALLDAQYVKHAHNAAFEWYCLSRHLGLADQAREAWVQQWCCTMLHGLYCGYPASLDAVGAALGLPQDKRKLAAGKALIRTFCAPVKPTESNGGRTRTMYFHEPEKWELFKEYCRQDVVTEMAIEQCLAEFPVPTTIQAQWEQDLAINARGVAVDLDLVAGALRCDEQVGRQMLNEAIAISGLDNPKSVTQLTKWLEKEIGGEISDLQKGTVKQLISDVDSDAARRMLELRQEFSKTSNKKYHAIEATVCADGRARGLLQFYGANRTGRWAGRLVQVQNLPQTKIDTLPLARSLVKAGKVESLAALYGSVPGALSQLIRTAFVAPKGRVLISADFSAIEARVIAWLAGEAWRQEVFATHGKIYEASASQMFGVPIEKIVKGRPEYALRQKGKVAELALGYQGAKGALEQMGALDMGLTEAELPEIVQRWRRANQQIVQLWYDLDNAAFAAVQHGTTFLSHGLTFARECDAGGRDFMTITLPSSRKLYYAQPFITTNRWGKEAIGYMGMNQTTRKWEPIETYGGKLVENVVQAIARDCLAEAIDRVGRIGHKVVMHIHDEIVAEVEPAEDGEQALKEVCAIMAAPIPWAPGLLLKADGYVSAFYRKD